MAGPINKFKEKGIEVAEWAGARGSSYSITKRYKPKDSEEWKDSKSFFESDLKILANLISQALAAKGVEAVPVARVDGPEGSDGKFETDDIPF